MLFVPALALFAASFGSAVAANGTCETWIAKTSTSLTYRVYFYDNGLKASYQAPPTLPANLTASSPAKLASAGDLGAQFTITNCSSTTQSSCTKGTCYTNFETNAQITYGGQCLTASSRTTNATFSFLPCDSSTPDTQLFALSQYVYYKSDGVTVTSVGEVDFSLIQAVEDDSSSFQPIAWYIGSDNYTVESILYGYTQAGLGAQILW